MPEQYLTIDRPLLTDDLPCYEIDRVDFVTTTDTTVLHPDIESKEVVTLTEYKRQYFSLQGANASKTKV